MSYNGLIAVSLAYVAILFVIAFAAERAAARGQLQLLRSPLVYTLSLSIYCTAWTFYGAVGSAARSGLEFITIYLGPTLVFIGWWFLLRKLVRVGKSQRVTSIADLISARYGKSNGLAVLVTVLAVVGTTPYISLQLQSVTLSFTAFADSPGTDVEATGLFVAIGLAIFTIIFGTRSLDANERHDGIVSAIAVEAVVKLAALLAVGGFVVWGVASGPQDILERVAASPVADWTSSSGRWVGLTFLSAAAIICLPRMFQVLVVEASDERHLATASWAFPLYLFAISIFVVPIAVVGLQIMPEGSNPDLFVLTIPLSLGEDRLAMLAFLGGFSSATSMVIVASVALATMLSNHIVMPLWLATKAEGATMSGDVRYVVLMARRISIAAVLAMGYLYYRLNGGNAALASIGLIAFAGLAQVLPALLGGLFWRGATRVGAGAGISIGFAIWGYTMLLPTFQGTLLPTSLFTEGPFGIAWLRPEGLFGIQNTDPLLATLVMSLGANTIAFCALSLLSFPTPLERWQGAQFINVFDWSSAPRGWKGGTAGAEELLIMAQRILGTQQAQTLFQNEAQAQGKSGYLPDPTPEFVDALERELSGSVGTATAHAMVGQLTEGATVSVDDLLAVADEAAQIMEYSARLETQSEELTRTARKLREANTKLTELSVQKDAFLSQVSHELRTPMTSIRAFSEILMTADLPSEDRRTYSGIIHDESQRLTRLLDDLLDLSVLENGQVVLNEADVSLHAVLERAVSSSSSLTKGRLAILRAPEREDVLLHTDADRLSQVFINLITNAYKYCDAETPQLIIKVRTTGTGVSIDFIDNGAGIPARSRGLIFEKFARLSDQAAAGSAGLGLAISREVMDRLGGSVDYLPGQEGAAFRVTLPRAAAAAPDVAAQ
jgi:Na+/proline symporter/nitrogen-specific signal transduction histidine kinase